MTEGHDPYNHNPYGLLPLMGRQWTAKQMVYVAARMREAAKSVKWDEAIWIRPLRNPIVGCIRI